MMNAAPAPPRRDVSWLVTLPAALGAAYRAAASVLQGPSAPLTPVVADPTPETRTVEPRLFQYLVGRNVLLAPRTDEPALTPYATLRRFARTYEVVGICIARLCAELAGLDWAIVPAAGVDAKPTDAQKAKIAELTAWWQVPDRAQGIGWRAWVQALVREDLEIAAPFLYLQPTYSGELYGLQVLQGDLQKIVIDARGAILGYQQYWRGVPTGPSTDVKVWTPDEILYAPCLNTAGGTYGIAPVEAALTTIQTALNVQAQRAATYTEGNIPQALISVPSEWNETQLTQYQQGFDALLAGQTWAKSRLHMVPLDTKTIHEFAPPSLDHAFDLWALHLVFALFGLTPERSGFTQDAKGRSTGEQQANSQHEAGVVPRAHWLEDLVTRVIQTRQHAPDLAFRFQLAPPDKADVLAVAQADALMMDRGVYGPLWVRTERGIQLAPDDPLILQEQADRVAAARAAQAPALPETAPEAPGTDAAGLALLHPAPDAEPPLDAPAAALAKAARDDLRRYRDYAVKRIAEGKELRPFVSDAIPAGVQTALHGALASATTVPAVKAAFAGVVAYSEER